MMTVRELIVHLQKATPDTPVNILVQDLEGDFLRFTHDVSVYVYPEQVDIVGYEGHIDKEDQEEAEND